MFRWGLLCRHGVFVRYFPPRWMDTRIGCSARGSYLQRIRAAALVNTHSIAGMVGRSQDCFRAQLCSHWVMAKDQSAIQIQDIFYGAHTFVPNHFLYWHRQFYSSPARKPTLRTKDWDSQGNLKFGVWSKWMTSLHLKQKKTSWARLRVSHEIPDIQYVQKM